MDEVDKGIEPTPSPPARMIDDERRCNACMQLPSDDPAYRESSAKLALLLVCYQQNTTAVYSAYLLTCLSACLPGGYLQKREEGRYLRHQLWYACNMYVYTNKDKVPTYLSPALPCHASHSLSCPVLSCRVCQGGKEVDPSMFLSVMEGRMGKYARSGL